MKRINPVVVLLIATGLFGGFLLFRNALQQPSKEPGTVRNGSLTTKAEVRSTSSPAATLQGEDMAPIAGVDSETKLKSASDSVTATSAEADPDIEQERMFCVTGLTVKASSVYVAVFESEAGFPKSELSNKTTVVSATAEQVRFSLELAENRPVAIAVFQDIDGNGKLSKNQIGIPTEPYGFSNNARGILGPPSFDQAMFTISNHRDRTEPIEIKVR